MLRFFRQIRQRLLTDNKFSKYLLYAIGEILLVVIGILIALQVNNWNEDRIEIEKSHRILREIRENIEYNSDRFKEEIEEEYAVINSIDIVLDNLKQAKGYHDSLGYHFLNVAYFPSPVRKSAGYENLKSQGVDIIRSDALRTGIIDLYEGTYAKMNDLTQISYDNAANSIWPLYTRLFKTESSRPGQDFKTLRVIPFDYDKLIGSNDYQGLASWWRHSRVVAIELRMEAIKQHSQILDQINKVLQE
ncbi:DUF6090 family protein [Robiginitalea sp. IMCC44478]|uniref:DUF6090 family protein n=1 Tax=Robiginitalea sp. IMCC44478 TaxID=3459122 RepID=UPI0040416404